MAVVKPGTGEVCHWETDFDLDGIIPIQLERFYLSSKHTSDGELGYGWDHTLRQRLRYTAEGQVEFIDEDGTTLPFMWTDPGHVAVYAPETPQQHELRLEDGWFRLSTPELTTLSFPSLPDLRGNMKVNSLETSNGHRLLFEYDTNGSLQTIEAPLGSRFSFEHDVTGRLVSIQLRVDSRDLLLARYQYDSDGNLVAVADSLGYTTRYQYRDHLLVAETNRSGGTSYFEYDSQRRAIRSWRDDGSLYREYDFDDVRRRVLVTDSLGYRTLIQLDEKGRMLSKTDAIGRKTESYYNERGELIASSGPSGDAVEMSVYNSEKRELVTINPLGIEERQIFNTRGQPIQIEDASGTWKAEYDERQNLKRVISPAGAVWEYEYDSQGFPIVIENPSGQRVVIDTSASRYAVTIRDQIGVIVQVERNGLWQITRSSDALGNAFRIDYDDLGRAVRITGPENTSIEYRYDAGDNLTGFVDQNGAVTQFEFDRFGQWLAKTDPLGDRVTCEYDTELRLIGVVNANGDRLTYRLDPVGRLIEQIGFDGQRRRLEYDEGDRLRAVRTADSVALFEYGSSGQMERIDLKGRVIEFENNSTRRLKSGILDGIKLEWKYNKAGELIEEVQHGYSVKYAYHISGDLAAVSAGKYGSIRYSYDIRGRLTGVTLPGGAQQSFEYDLADNPVRREMPGCHEALTYSPSGLLTSQNVRNAGGEIVVSRRNSYDRCGRLLKVDEADGSCREYTYDAAGRLLEFRDGNNRERYAFDPEGNLVFSTPVGQMRYAPGNRISSAGDRCFEWDAAGNISAEVRAGERYDYRYGPGGLRAVVRPDATRVELHYDVLERLVGLNDAGETSRYLWAADAPLGQITRSGMDLFAFVPDDYIPLALEHNGHGYSFVLDHRGAPTDVLDETGQCVWSAGYNPWGKLLRETAKDGVKPSLRLPGQIAVDSELYYNRYRFYHPSIGRYLSADPVGLVGGTNFYQYPPDPVNTIDPLGLAALALPPLAMPQGSGASYLSPHNGPVQCGKPNPFTKPKKCPRRKRTTPTRPMTSSGCRTSSGKRRGGGNNAHNKLLEDIAQSNQLTSPNYIRRGGGPSDFRVNRSQTNFAGNRVGFNRPDMSVDRVDGRRHHIEVDKKPASRAGCHGWNTCDNDPNAVVHLIVF